MPIDHVNIPVVDLAGSKTFYAAALAPIGCSDSGSKANSRRVSRSSMFRR